MAAEKKTTDRISTFPVWNPYICSHYRWLGCGCIANIYIDL